MSTKLRGDIVEQEATLEGLRLGWGVLQPHGDRLPYDLVYDVRGVLVKIQVKAAWPLNGAHTYAAGDFDFALVRLPDVWYVFPVEFFVKYRGAIALGRTRQASWVYRDAWNLIEGFASDVPGNVLEPSRDGGVGTSPGS